MSIRETYEDGVDQGVKDAIKCLENTGYRDAFGRSAENHLRYMLLGEDMPAGWVSGDDVSEVE